MEFKDFIKLIGKYKHLLILIVLLFLVAGFFVWRYQTDFYLASFSVDIDRNNFQQSEEYKYDQFYRLEADEKFAENIVYWAGDPSFLLGVKKDFLELGGENFGDIKGISANQLSSNYVKIEYKGFVKKEVFTAYKALKKNLQEKTKKLNYENNDPNWFKLNNGELVVHKGNPSLLLYLSIALAAGFLAGIFLILFIYYFKESHFDENRN
ncbi:MAG: hypothetical protein R6V40_00865 [Candidatus Moraniibacteriota bacterium]